MPILVAFLICLVLPAAAAAKNEKMGNSHIYLSCTNGHYFGTRTKSDGHVESMKGMSRNRFR
jgi:hypothetical protein